MKRDSDRLDVLIDPAIQVLKSVFKGGESTEQEITTARIASSTLATWSRLKQAERAQEAVYFNMARELAEDKQQLAAYVKASMPDVPIVRVLEAKKLPALKDGK